MLQVARCIRRRFEALRRLKVIVGSLAAGAALCAAMDLGVRRGCPPTTSASNYWPRPDQGELVKVDGWVHPLDGVAYRGLGWRDFTPFTRDISTMFDIDIAGGSISPWRPTLLSAPEAAERLGLRSLLDTQPLDERYGAQPRLRATRFGWPWASSVREFVSAVRSAGPPARSDGLMVLVQEGWIWKPEAASVPVTLLARAAERNWVLTLGAAGNTLVFAAAGLFAWSTPLLVRDLRRARRGACLACGYSLAGLIGETCPECGARRR